MPALSEAESSDKQSKHATHRTQRSGPAMGFLGKRACRGERKVAAPLASDIRKDQMRGARVGLCCQFLFESIS